MRYLFLAILAVTMSNNALAQTSQQTLDQNMRNANEVSQRQQRDRDREQMRDTSHDNRLMINRDTSVGVGPDGVNVRTTRGQ